MKILGSVSPVVINPLVAKSLKLKDDFAFFAISNEILDKFNVKGFDVINSDNKLILIAQPESQATSENKSPAKEIISDVR